MAIKKADNKDLLWKIYFFFFIIILIISYKSAFQSLGLVNLVDLIVSIPSLVSLYGLAFRKKILKAAYWKAYFYFFAAWYIAINMLIPNLMKAQGYVSADLAGTIITIPLYIALYSYGFKYLER